MAKSRFITGLDVGTANIRIVVLELNKNSEPRVITAVDCPSSGLRKGIVMDIAEAKESISQCLRKAEDSAGIHIKEAWVNIGGSHISILSSKGGVAVSRASGEISEGDLERVISEAKAVSIPQNKETIHIIPQKYKVDSEENIKNPLGMQGIKLEVDTLIIYGGTPYIKNLSKAVLESGIEIVDLVFSPLASSLALLDSRQKELGSMILDIGGGITNFAVFEEGDLIHAGTIPVGASHVTNDIAIGLRIPIDLAEEIKIKYGNCFLQKLNKKEMIDLSEWGEEGKFFRKELSEIIEARWSEIFDLVNKELRKIGREKLLPAGVILTGGGAKTEGIVELTKKELKLPCFLGSFQLDDISFSTALGLALWGQDQEKVSGTSTQGPVFKLKKWFKAFLP